MLQQLQQRSSQSGFTLVEVIIVSVIMVLIFGAVFSSFQYSLRLINQSRAKLSAISVANDRMEYFRSLPYNDVGTISGIPSGTIPQNSTVTLNGIDFAERVLVEYVDDPADGQDTATTSDSNGIPSDYKRIKLEYTWNVNDVPGEIMFVSNIVPRSIETTAGGGTVRVNVIGADSNLLPGASVRLINTTTTSTIDVTRVTDPSGAALFSGAPAASNYQVIVTGPIGGADYSVDQTYVATTSNPSPIVAPFSVLEADVSTLTFQIGELSDLTVRTLSDLTDDFVEENFTDLSGLAATTTVESNGTELVLEDTAGTYVASGMAYLTPIEPASLVAWQSVRVAADTPLDTAYRVSFYTGSGTGPFTLIPDGDLPQNSAGFVDSIIDISGLDVGAYPSIVIGIELETSDTSKTPLIDAVAVAYRESETTLGSKSFGLWGDKLIGAGVYKYAATHTTDVSGELTLPDLEFDVYSAGVTGHDIAMSCPGNPFAHQAGIDGALELLMAPLSDHTLHVSVVDALGRGVPGAQIELSRPGLSDTTHTNGCGQVFFPGLVEALDYDLIVTVAGYNTVTEADFEVSGDTKKTITLTLD